MPERDVEVFVRLEGHDVLAGRLWLRRRRGAETASFTYDPGYVRRDDAYALDPALPLDTAPHHTSGSRKLFGAFADSAPDRWGRRLIQRDERARVELEGGAERSFGEGDYLLGVRDDLRLGSLRFRDPAADRFLADEMAGVPHLLDLPELLSAAEHLERDDVSHAELRTLLRGGSSLGGARPKAHVLDRTRRIAIAKFPSPTTDDWDVIRWEAVALTLAGLAGVAVPDHELHVIDGKPVLIVDRFDRVGAHRIGYVSAMTMLEASDGEKENYLDIGAVVEENSPRAGADLHQLWRRMAFTVLIRNTDDHLRNHGFLRTSSAGWTLSPAFDLNPDPSPGPAVLSTALDFGAFDADVGTLLGVAGAFRLSDAEARTVLSAVAHATARWREVAGGHGLGDGELERMRAAFEHEQAGHAAELVG